MYYVIETAKAYAWTRDEEVGRMAIAAFDTQAEAEALIRSLTMSPIEDMKEYLSL